MDIAVDVWLRGELGATTHPLGDVAQDPKAWTDADVATLLEGMLRAMNLAKNPDADPDQAIVLRGFSWIVNPFETGGVVVAIEMSLGAAVAGPFDLAESDLTTRIQRVMDAQRRPASGPATVH
jgi:hypothetical protein